MRGCPHILIQTLCSTRATQAGNAANTLIVLAIRGPNSTSSSRVLAATGVIFTLFLDLVPLSGATKRLVRVLLTLPAIMFKVVPCRRFPHAHQENTGRSGMEAGRFGRFLPCDEGL